MTDNGPRKKEFTIVRDFDASPATIWRAWTDPDIAATWWHPRGFTSPREHMEIDARTGGKYFYLMVNDKDGSQFPTGGTYLEVDEPNRLVFTWGEPDGSVDDTPVITVVLAAHGDKTRMTFHVNGIDGQPGDGFVYDGWGAAFDILNEHLEINP